MSVKDNNQLYLAPMEGITGYIFRNAFVRHFGGADKYFTPFIANKKLSSKEIRECCPENNQGISLVPQILTNREDDFILIARELKERFGYEEVNFNLGCPSNTVVAKNRGSGFLRELDRLDQFLEYIFENVDARISVKTRIGVEDSDDWARILEIYNRYPLSELIIHPRKQVDGYKGKIDLEAFRLATQISRHRLCYNGDINTLQDYNTIINDYPMVSAVMCGRGIISNPGLFNEIRGMKPSSPQELLAFVDDIYRGYCDIMSGDTNTLYKMKEIWGFVSCNFENSDKVYKRIKKCNSCRDYEALIMSLH